MIELDKIYNMDCLEGMKAIPDSTIDCIICDLPYGVLNSSSEGGQWDVIIPFEPLWKQYLRVCKKNAAIVLFCQGMFTARLMMSNPKMWRYNLVWDKGRKSGFLNANRMPLRQHEDIAVFYRELPTYNPQMNFGWYNHNYVNLTTKEKTDAILTRSMNREKFFRLCVKMFSVAEQRGLLLIMENPWSMQTFLKANFIFPPSLIDNDRSKRGDYYKKPTAYWFMNCKPTHGRSLQQLHKPKRIIDQPHERGGGICSEIRSMISPDYARNFICDFILGKEQKYSQRTLFDM